MRVADVHCATCGACIGWKFVSDLSPALENCNQASASRGRRVEGRGSGRGNGRCEERGGRQNDETYSQGGCVPRCQPLASNPACRPPLAGGALRSGALLHSQGQGAALRASAAVERPLESRPAIDRRWHYHCRRPSGSHTGAHWRLRLGPPPPLPPSLSFLCLHAWTSLAPCSIRSAPPAFLACQPSHDHPATDLCLCEPHALPCPSLPAPTSAQSQPHFCNQHHPLCPYVWPPAPLRLRLCLRCPACAFQVSLVCRQALQLSANACTPGLTGQLQPCLQQRQGRHGLQGKQIRENNCWQAPVLMYCKGDGVWTQARGSRGGGGGGAPEALRSPGRRWRWLRCSGRRRLGGQRAPRSLRLPCAPLPPAARSFRPPAQGGRVWGG